MSAQTQYSPDVIDEAKRIGKSPEFVAEANKMGVPAHLYRPAPPPAKPKQEFSFRFAALGKGKEPAAIVALREAVTLNKKDADWMAGVLEQADFHTGRSVAAVATLAGDPNPLNLAGAVSSLQASKDAEIYAACIQAINRGGQLWTRKTERTNPVCIAALDCVISGLESERDAVIHEDSIRAARYGVQSEPATSPVIRQIETALNTARGLRNQLPFPFTKHDQFRLVTDFIFGLYPEES